MDSILRLADVMAKRRATVPAHFYNNAADCAAVIMQSIQWRMNPFAVAQKTHVVSGTLGYEAQLVNAVIQSSGVTTGRFNYEWYGAWEKIIGKSKVIDMPPKDGKKAYQFRAPDYDLRDEDGLGVRVWATLKGEAEPRVLELLMVQASVRNSPLWTTDPKQQLAYLAVKRWTRLFAPDVILGVYTPDELEETRPQERDVTPPAPAQPTDQQPPAALFREAQAASATGVAGYRRFWKQTGPHNRELLKRDHEALKTTAVGIDESRTVEVATPEVAAPAGESPPPVAAANDDKGGAQPVDDYVPE